MVMPGQIVTTLGHSLLNPRYRNRQALVVGVKGNKVLIDVGYNEKVVVYKSDILDHPSAVNIDKLFR
jgi:hypothetical protein